MALGTFAETKVPRPGATAGIYAAKAAKQYPLILAFSRKGRRGFFWVPGNPGGFTPCKGGWNSYVV
jgi:hypothetical protein